MSRFERWRALMLSVALGSVTFGFYMVAAGRSYDYDSSETVGAFVATKSLLDPLRRQIAFNNHPLFSVLEHVVYSVGGTSESALRVLPCLFGALTVAVVAGWLGRGSLLAGLSAGLLIAADPLFATEARSVRGYSLLALGAAVSTLLLARLLQRADRLREILYVLALGVAIATHLYALFVLAGHVGAVVGARKLDRRWLSRWAAALLLGGSVYVGLASTMLAAGRGESRHFVARFPLAAARALLGVSPLAIVLFALLVALGVVAARRPAITAAAIIVTGALLFEWVVWAPTDLYPRFLIWLVPAFAALAAAAVARWRVTAILVASAVAAMATVDAQHWQTPMLASRSIAQVVGLLGRENERVCALPYTRGALMAYTTAPPEITRATQLQRCDAVVAIETAPAQLLAQARLRFPDQREFRAIRSMFLLTREPHIPVRRAGPRAEGGIRITLGARARKLREEATVDVT